MDPTSVTHLYRLTDHIGCVMTGTTPDSLSAVAKARSVAAAFQYDNGYPIPVHHLAKKMADENQIYTQAAYKRSLACIMILGWSVCAAQARSFHSPRASHTHTQLTRALHPAPDPPAAWTTSGARSCSRWTPRATSWATRPARRASRSRRR